MKLLTNENNPEVVKILIAGELSNKKINVVPATADSSDVTFPKRLPQLILDSGVHLFSSNASLKYLLPPTNNETDVNYFLDYEANVIQPIISCCSGKIDAKLQSSLISVLSNLNNTLSNKEYLTGGQISAADVSIWATLYPLITEPKYATEYLSSRNSLKNWFEKVQKLPAVQNTLKSYKLTNGISSITNLCAAHWFPNTQISKLTVDLDRVGIQEDGDKSSRGAPEVTDEEVKSASEAWLDRTKRKLPKQAVHPVLPVPGERNILVTSALPYVNNVPHLGNIIGCVLSGDVFTRYCRQRNYNVIHVCGTDEYGTATETKALEEGLTPQQICDKYFAIHDEIYKWFNIKFDEFGRTTTPEQKEIAQSLFLKLHQNGFIFQDSVDQLHCNKCDRYLADRFVEGTCPRCSYEDARGDQCDGCGHLIVSTELIKPRCKMCQTTPVVRSSGQFFLDLPKIEPELKVWMEKSWMSWSRNAREISKAWLNEGLKARCITRDLKWGIPVPIKEFANKVFYVWFDAPIGYMSITKRYTKDWEKWWTADNNTKVSLYQFMAKDNVPFHSVLFPSTLIGCRGNFIRVENIFATEYLNYEDGKFSKSRGIGVFGNDAKDTGIPADIWRFYLLYVRPESQDSSFSWNDLALKNNSELLNILGNFINRALVFAEKNYNSKVPEIHLTEEDYKFLALVNRELTGYIAALERGKLREGIRHILSIARLGNVLMQDSQPWVLFKGNPEEQKRGATVIGLSVNLSCFLSVLLYPYMPDTSETIQKQLNADPSVNVIEDRFRLLLEPGHTIGKPSPLFIKIEMSRIEELQKRFAGRQKSKTPEKTIVKPVATANDVASLEAAVTAQGNLVRQMKSSGKDKSEWQPEVAVLLDLKKKLEAAKANAPTAEEKPSGGTPSGDTTTLEKAIEEQGNLVRKMKESGVERAQWQPEVNKLLNLKKQLAELKGEPIPENKKGKKSK